MTISFSCEPFSIIRGNAIEVLKQLQTKVDCVITSPAYYQQRNYGTSASELGREPSVAEYIGNLVAVFKAIPLAPWGSIWVNIGDKRGKQGELLGIPERFVTDMCDAGFYQIDSVIGLRNLSASMAHPSGRR
jgi:DNA modification methylase